MNTISDSKEPSKIVDFYHNKVIFITGASGFIGKVLVEKLLRTCLDIKKIYILLRGKKGKTQQQRFDLEFTQCKLFEKIDRKLIETKIQLIDGDLTVENLGLKKDDIIELSSNVNIVFHIAASLNFTEPIKKSIQYNVIGTKYIVELCNLMKNLNSLVHVSTAYAYCHLNCCEEKLYPLKASSSQIIEASKWMNDFTLKECSKSLMEGRPNIYTFTKAIAEHYINDNSANLPVAIARPSIVTASVNEPFPGWVDSVNGPSGSSILAALGILLTMKCNPNYKADLIPVDIVTNSLIAIAWKTSVDFQKQHKNSNGNTISSDGHKEFFDRSISKTVPIYNLTSGDINPITWGQYLSYVNKYGREIPSSKMVRIPEVKGNKTNSLVHLATQIFRETLFAYLFDMILLLIGYKARMVRIVQKMHHLLDCVEFFTTRNWSFPCDNLLSLCDSLDETDRKLFNFDIRTLNWNEYSHNLFIGMRRHLMKEEDESIPEALKRMHKLKIAYRILILVIYALFVMLFVCLFPVFKYIFSSCTQRL